jgi:hypothetical protein
VALKPEFWRQHNVSVRTTTIDGVYNDYLLGGRAFDLILKGFPVCVEHNDLDADADLLGTPIIAMSDAARWARTESLAEPSDVPEGWIALAPATTPADRAKVWIAGYATGVARGGTKAKRDDEHMKEHCMNHTGCRAQDVRDAYAELPVELRNPAPARRPKATPRAD